MDNNTPITKPVDVKQYEVKQSKFAIAPKLPIRSIMLGPSGSGKNVLLQSMILDIERLIRSNILDDTIWRPVRDYIDENNTLKEKTYFDTYNPDEVLNITETQKNVIEMIKIDLDLNLSLDLNLLHLLNERILLFKISLNRGIFYISMI